MKPKFGIGTAKQSAVVPLPRRLKKLPRGDGLLKLNASTKSAETTPAPRAEAAFRGKATRSRIFGPKGTLMAALKFMCPVTGRHVDTGLELDAQSFANLSRESTELVCPHCDQPHILAGVSAWLGELQPEYE